MMWIWLIMTIVFIVIEIVTVQLTTIWFAAGSFITMILCVFGVDNISTQFIVFVCSSALLLIATRPLVKKYLIKKKEPTNADRNIGLVGIVVTEINNIENKGSVKLGGIVWSAHSSDGAIIPEGSKVTVEKIEGAKLIVKNTEKMEETNYV